MTQNLRGQIKGGYNLLQMIGSGGFGAVYRAHQEIVDREVAVKVILREHANNPEFIRSFDAEAHLIARLEHPFIVPLYDYWREPDGAYIIMRFYPAGSLANYLTHQGAISLEDTARMLEQIASALDAAHHHNILHRDIKPANILLDNEGNAYLSDFGLAKDMSEEDEENRIVGSPAYIAPELIQSEQPSPVSDIYSLGFVIHEMLTGEYAYTSMTPSSSIISILDFHLRKPVPDILEVPDTVNIVLQRATAKDPQDRYQSATEMAKAFRRAITGGSDTDNLYQVSSEFIINPYKGLRAFEEADAQDFFGREALVKRLLEQLDERHEHNNFLALVGPSGSGKSSVVHAGLLPALREGRIEGSENWFIINMVPGASPLSQLSAGLRSIAPMPMPNLEQFLSETPSALKETISRILFSEDDKIILVIDQFEEVFTQTEDSVERQQFLDLLYQTLESKQLYIIIMLRADFYDRPMFHEGFGSLMQARTQVVLPLTSTDLTDVINSPAKRAGLQVESDLTAAIIADVHAEAVALPLLQYALTEVFDRRSQNVLTIDAYRDIGGIAGALAHRADELFSELEDETQQAARQIFLRLVTLGEGTEDTRRRAKRSELLSVVGDNALLQSVLDMFGKARLLTFDNDEETREPTVEVAHEALIREWQKLRNWLDESRDDIRQQRILHNAAIEWQAANQDASYLLRGTHLTHLMEWAESSDVQLNTLETHYLQKSVENRKKQEEMELARKRREDELEQRSRNRLRYLVMVFAGAAVIALILTAIAFNSLNIAETERDKAEYARETSVANAAIAEDARATSDINAQLAEDSRIQAARQAEEAQSIALAAYAQREYSDGDVELALALALAASNIDTNILAEPPEIAYDTLVEISHAPGLIYEEELSEISLEHIAISPDGRFVVAGHGRNPASYWTGRSMLPPGANMPPQGQPPQGQPPQGQPPQGQPPQGQPPQAVPQMPSDLILWDIHRREQLGILAEHTSTITSLIFMLDDSVLGYTFASASDDGTVIIWDMETYTVRHRINEIPAGFINLSASEDGQRLLISSADQVENTNEHVLVDTQSGEILQRIPAHQTGLALAQITPDGQSAISIYTDGTQISWNIETGEEVARFKTSDNVRLESYNISINTDNQTVASNTGNLEIQLWNLQTGQELGVAQSGATATHLIEFNGDGTQLLTATRDGLLSVWDVEGQFFIREIQGTGSFITSLSWEENGNIAVAGTLDGTLRFYAMRSEPIDLITDFGGQGVASDVVFVPSSDGLQALVAIRNHGNTGGNILVLWNADTREEIRHIGNFKAPQNELSISTDGQYLLVNEKPDTQRVSTTQQAVAQNTQPSQRALLWDLEQGKIIYETICPPHTGDNTPIAVLDQSSDLGAIIACGNELWWWNLETGELKLWQEFEQIVTAIDFGQTGDIIVILTQSGELVWLDALSGNIHNNIQLEGEASAVKLLHDKQTVAITMLTMTENEEDDDDNEQDDDDTAYAIVLIDLKTGETLQTLIGHDLKINSLDITDDGQFLVSGSDDTIVIYWNLDSGEIVKQFELDARVTHVSFSPDETMILTNTEDGIPQLWQLASLTLDEAIAWAEENRQVRELNPSECVRLKIENLCSDDDDDDD